MSSRHQPCFKCVHLYLRNKNSEVSAHLVSGSASNWDNPYSAQSQLANQSLDEVVSTCQNTIMIINPIHFKNPLEITKLNLVYTSPKLGCKGPQSGDQVIP